MQNNNNEKSERSCINCFHHQVCNQSVNFSECRYFKDYSEIIDLNPAKFNIGDICIYTESIDDKVIGKYVVKIIDVPWTSQYISQQVEVEIIKKIFDKSRRFIEKIDFSDSNSNNDDEEIKQNMKLTSDEKKFEIETKLFNLAFSRFINESIIACYKKQHKKGSIITVEERELEKIKESEVTNNERQKKKLPNLP